MSRHKSDTSYTLDLFSQRRHPAAEHPELTWPEAARFPLNLDTIFVQHSVLPDLKQSREPLIVTGFAALDRIIDFVADADAEAHVRIVFGSEPFPSRRESFEVGGASFPKEVEHYWLERGISLRLSAKLLQCIERLKSRHTLARYVAGSGGRLHAKIYCGDSAATLGSSNFTRPGMEAQLEANARFTRGKDRQRYEELVQIAENYWTMGVDYNEQLIRLLERLLRRVSWQEALARACAELLEGDWAQAYLRGEYLPGDVTLWPSQKQGIAQALYILARQGSVLVADATGSGKTRMGVHLIGAVADDILRKGRIRQGKALMVCPPPVLPNWEWESHLAGVPIDTYSHGTLSHAKSRRHELTLEALRRAQILCVDEGHNFLNLGSTRTQKILRHMADHVLLFTATPINRSARDLLRIVDLLGADNLQEDTLKMFRKLLGARHINRTFTEPELDVLRKEIQRFTVRRTKRMLNELIRRDPEHYRDKNGKPCHFPRHKPEVYALHESDADRALAGEIRGLADELYGVTHFRKTIELPDALARMGVTEDRYLAGRLHAAKKLARYIIMASLRSSRIALAEHIVGTRQAVQDFGLDNFHKQKPTGNVLETIDKLKDRLPNSKLSIDLPDWLSDEDAHRKACEHDKKIYRKIYQLLGRMSDAREVNKARQILALMKKHDLLLAFDSKPISLAEIERQITRLTDKYRVITATGDQASQRSDVLEIFGLDSEASKVIGLCSDSLSEGVNLQRASALLHLDMPTVVRIAEQRVGRIDRMDSPHRTIQVWWPQDAPEFALSSDERFVERYETVEALLGSNMPLPDEMHVTHAKPISVDEIIREYEQDNEFRQWDGIQDAFAPVRSLVSGQNALIDADTYEHYRKIRARVLSRVSVVKSQAPWAFFCITGGSFDAPRWVFLPSYMGAAVTELDDVCTHLRERLGEKITDLELDQKAASQLEKFLQGLSFIERTLLPRKKQRALEEMEYFIQAMLKQSAQELDQEKLDAYQALLDMLICPNPYQQPDWDEVAARWLDIIRLIWYEKLKESRTQPLLLKDIRKDLIASRSRICEAIYTEFKSFPVLPTPDERITACIIGMS